MTLHFLPFNRIPVFPVNERLAMVGLGVLLLILAICLLLKPRRKIHVAKLGGLIWRRNQFCRGWLITGDTGSGKTSSGINQLAHQVFQNEPTWGGLCVDEKGVYWETLADMARHYRREHDLIHLHIHKQYQEKPNGSALGFEAKLWQTADKLSAYLLI